MSLKKLEQWIGDEHRSGMQRDAIAQALAEMGWHAEAGRMLLSSVLEGTAPGALCDLHDRPLPGIDLDALATVLEVDGRAIDVRMFVRHPRIVLFGNFLSSEECDALISATRPRLAPSNIYDVQEAHHDGLASYGRTSESVMLDRDIPDLVFQLEARAAELLGWPVERFEYMQVVRYRPGEEFAPHHDYFEPAFPATAQLVEHGGNRVGSVLLYLNTPDRGGSTLFTDIQLEVMPQRGCALFFSYGAPHPSTLTMHGGAPVVCGEKWLASIFMREGTHRESAGNG